MSRLSREKGAEYIVKILKRRESRPCFIERNKNIPCLLCKRKHDEFLIKDFDSENGVFSVVHGNHNQLPLNVVKQTPFELQTFLLQCFQKKHVILYEILKKIDISEFKKTQIMKIRFSTPEEKERLATAAKREGVTLSQYIRSKLLS
jgi:hypothetical protein